MTMIKIVNMLPRLHHLPNQLGTLKPGPNTVSVDTWEKAKKWPAVQRAIDRGHLVPNSDKLPPPQTAPIATSAGPEPVETKKVKKKGKEKPEEATEPSTGELAEFPESDVLEVIANEDSIERLQGYLKGETRRPIKEAIAMRIKTVRSEQSED